MLFPFAPNSTANNVIVDDEAFRMAAEMYGRGEPSSFQFNLGLERLVFPTVTAHARPHAFKWTGTTETDMGELVFGHLTVAFGQRSAWKQGRREVTGELFFADRNWKVRTRNSGVVTVEHVRLPIFHPWGPADFPVDDYGLGTFHRNATEYAEESVGSTDLESMSAELESLAEGLAPPTEEETADTGRRLLALGTGSAVGPANTRIRVLVLFDRPSCTTAEFTLATSIEASMRVAWEVNMEQSNFEVVYTCAALGLARLPMLRHYMAARSSAALKNLRQRYGGDLLVVINEASVGSSGLGTMATTPR